MSNNNKEKTKIVLDNSLFEHSLAPKKLGTVKPQPYKVTSTPFPKKEK